MSTNRSVKLSVMVLGLLTALMLSLTLPQFGQVAHAAKDYQGQMDALLEQINAMLAQINAQQAQISALTTQLNAESAKLADVTADPLTGDLFVTGVNLHVRSGSGATDGEVNGAGNLIIGYTETAITNGSHNLVVGAGNSYSSYGGIVAGLGNWIAAPYASVTGGTFNGAYGDSSSVSGGIGNAAWGANSSVSGGFYNSAQGQFSSVSGGHFNFARGESSSVSGGLVREANDKWNWSAGSLFEIQ